MARKGRKKVTPEMIKEMKRLRKEGLSYNKIASRLGLSVMTVYNHLKKEKKEEKVGLIERLKRAFR